MIRYIAELLSPEWESSFPRPVILLGNTGSIGINTLCIIEKHSDLFQVVALARERNVERLIEQALRWRPSYLGIQTEKGRGTLLATLPSGYEPEIFVNPQGYAGLVSSSKASMVFSAQVGAAGLRAAIAAAEAGEVIRLANKESLVLAGEVLWETCARTEMVILPVDSKHNAVLQGLRGRSTKTVRRTILTASGDPFRGRRRDSPATVTPAQAFRHFNWSMGTEVTIDSVSIANKGLEIIETHHLYGLPLEYISVLAHPQSLMRSLVEFGGDSLMAQAGTPDVRMPIAYYLMWPLCLDTSIPPLNPVRSGALISEEPDLHSFSCLGLACRAIGKGSTLPVALNATDEIAIEALLSSRIGFIDVPGTIGQAPNKCSTPNPASLETIETLDHETRLHIGLWTEKM